MIGKLKGKIEEKSKESVILDVQGVGYELHMPETVLARIPEVGSDATIFVYTHVREDQISLFGFSELLEKDVFKLLLGASGIGPKLALSILSGLDARSVLEAISQGNKTLFHGISGVGKKTVEKLILELREKAEKRMLLERGFVDTSKQKARGVDSAGVSAWATDLEQALLALGYREQEVRAVVRETLNGNFIFENFETALKHALKLHSSAVSGAKATRGYV